MELNYFVCTLGQAADQWKTHSSIGNIGRFIEHQSKTVPDHTAVIFPYPQQSQTPPQQYTFSKVAKATRLVAQRLAEVLPKSSGQDGTVALLCPSTPEFLFAWLGLVRLGYSVMLIAPQCQPVAITHLCKSCEVGVLLHDSTYTKLTVQSTSHGPSVGHAGLKAITLPFSTHEDRFQSELEKSLEPSQVSPDVQPSSIAYLFHTSGTSSGLPKPIPQTHHAAVGALPHFPEGKKASTFSTTPLYHGGIADLFRAWTSDAMICLYPGKSLEGTSIPITAKNIVSCLDSVHGLRDTIAPLRYFSSVPYVLQLLAADAKGLDLLRSMDCVGVGGAALPPEIGDSLVQDGVKLVSRYGSAECGFLLSSHRDYANDKDWQYLRAEAGSKCLSFEQCVDERFELVVRPGWPHLAKSNRQDGSYATSDLFLSHRSIPNTWKYDSRADSQLTLITGKKFDPSPLEASIATSDLLDDVLIFGNNKPFPGALLFRSENGATTSDEELVSLVEPLIEKLNSESQVHARIGRNMLLPIPHGKNRLQKSSKGTVIRKQAEGDYDADIHKMYESMEAPAGECVKDSDIIGAIRGTISSICGVQVGDEDELVSSGIDSVAAMQIRHAIRRLLPPDCDQLPMSIVEDCGNVQRLAAFITKCRCGGQLTQIEDQLQLMQSLVDEHGSFDNDTKASNAKRHSEMQQGGEVVLLTGVTGALGAHILNTCLHSKTILKIVCLVRGTDEHAASERVSKSLVSRGLSSTWSPRPPSRAALDGYTEGPSPSVLVLPCKLSDPFLGLTKSQYSSLTSEVTTIIHAAWSVNFRMHLRSFKKDHIAGLRHLLDFSLRCHPTPRFAFVSSIASVSEFQTSNHIPELPSSDPRDASPLGYSRSKWVGEQICLRAVQQCERLRGKVCIMRVGQLSGDTAKGIWNAAEAWPLLLGSVQRTGCLPLLDETVGWLPVDLAARAVVDVMDRLREADVSQEDARGMPVLHILNDDSTVMWSHLLTWLQDLGEKFDVVGPETWIKSLEELQVRRPDYPPLKLLGIWKARYSSERRDDMKPELENSQVQDAGQHNITRGKHFDTAKAKVMAPVLAKDMRPVDEAYFEKLWMWIKHNIQEA